MTETFIAVYIALGIATVGVLFAIAIAQTKWEPPATAREVTADIFIVFYAIALWPLTLLAVLALSQRR